MELISEIKKPGFVDFKILNNKPKLDDLWFMIGSRCNLTCKHCYVSSSPTNNTLEQIDVEDIKPFIKEATKFGLKNIYFTGGEPFVNKNIMEIIEYSLKFASVTILTNATYPITRFIPSLEKIRNKNNLILRVSLDHHSQKEHDSLRGPGSFRFTLKNVEKLLDIGFKPIITITNIFGNLSKEIETKIKSLFSREVDVKFIPQLEMGANLQRINPSKHVFISEDCMKGVEQKNFQCHNGRTVEKINGKMIVYPCPIIYDDKKFELATNLKDSFKKIYITHKACYDFCYKEGGKCIN